MRMKEVITKLQEDHKISVTPDRVRYYGKKGLLSPARTSPNNSRDYSHRDYIDLCIIVLLSEAGVSLELVRRLLVYGEFEALGEINRIIDGRGFTTAKASVAMAQCFERKVENEDFGSD